MDLYRKHSLHINFSKISILQLAKQTHGESHRSLAKMMAKAVRLAIARNADAVEVTMQDCIVSRSDVKKWDRKVKNPRTYGWKHTLIKHAPTVLKYGLQAAAIAIPLYFSLKQEARAVRQEALAASQEARAARQEATQNDMNTFQKESAIIMAKAHNMSSIMADLVDKGIKYCPLYCNRNNKVEGQAK